MNKEGKHQGERIAETGRDKVIESGRFSRYVKEGKKVTKCIPKYIQPDSEPMLQAKKSPIVILRVV